MIWGDHGRWGWGWHRDWGQLFFLLKKLVSMGMEKRLDPGEGDAVLEDKAAVAGRGSDELTKVLGLCAREAKVADAVWVFAFKSHWESINLRVVGGGDEGGGRCFFTQQKGVAGVVLRCRGFANRCDVVLVRTRVRNDEVRSSCIRCKGKNRV